MAKTVPPLSDWVANYAASPATGAPKWFKKVQAVQGWQAAALSDHAKTQYQARVQAAIAAGTRERKIAKVSDSDWHASIQAAGQGSYSSGVTNKAAKYAKGASKLPAILQGLVNQLPPRGPNYAANKARIDTIAGGLEAAKLAGST